MESLERAPDGTLTSHRLPSSADQDALDPRLAVGADGTAVMLWRPVGGQNGFGLRAAVELGAAPGD